MLPNAYADVAQTSLIKGASSAPEMYIPLWWYSGSVASFAVTSNTFIQKGTTAVSNSASSSQRFITLNSSWPSTLNYAFEVALQCNGSGNTATAYLYDFTTPGTIAGSVVSTTATTFTVVRSSQFSLTPGHVYGVVAHFSTTAATGYLTDASLIVFP